MTYSRIIITLAVATISAGLLLPGSQLARNIIRFPQPPDTALNASPVTLSAEASSALAVTYASNSLAICTVSGSSVTLLAVGVCSITANQSGNGTFLAADPAVVTFSALQGAQTIQFHATT